MRVVQLMTQNDVVSVTAPAPGAAEVLDRWFKAINAHDLDALVELSDPNIEIVPLERSVTSPPGTSYHGHDGLRTMLSAAFERFPQLAVEHSSPLRELGVQVTVDLAFVLDDGVNPTTRREAASDYRISNGRINRIVAFERDDPRHGSKRPTTPLSPREAEVLSLMAAGLTIDEIAEKLVLSPLTVRTHVRNARERLEARTTVQAIALALENGGLDV